MYLFYLLSLGSYSAAAQESFAGCLDDSEFLLLNDTVTFSQAVEGCVQEDGNTAVPANQAENEFVVVLAS